MRSEQHAFVYYSFPNRDLLAEEIIIGDQPAARDPGLLCRYSAYKQAKSIADPQGYLRCLRKNDFTQPLNVNKVTPPL